MVEPAQIVTFDDAVPPPGADPWVGGHGPGTEVAVVDPDPAWAEQGTRLLETVRAALGGVVVGLEHVGSTSVPGLAAKPIIDLVLSVADPGDEEVYVPALESQGFVLTVREPWWHQHRMLRHHAPRANLHVHPAGSVEPVRMVLFRDWLRTHADDRELYAAAKRSAAAAAQDAGEHVMQYNARKQAVVRGIYARIFADLGYSAPPG